MIRRDQRGTAMTELAFVLPVLAVFAFGVIELGGAWRSRLTVQTAVRAGVRVGSAEGKIAAADQGILLASGSVLYDIGLSNVDWVIVYKSSTSDGAVPAGCLTPAPHSVSGSCNVYTGSQLAQVVAGTNPGTWFGCGVGALDGWWCPATRQSVQALGNDYLGVRVTVRHPMMTTVLGSRITLTDDAVMRLEPQEA